MQCEGAGLGNRKLWWPRWWDERRQPPLGTHPPVSCPQIILLCPLHRHTCKCPLMCPQGACFKGSWPHSESAMWEL